MCRNVIGYNLTPQHKGFLCRILKKHAGYQSTILAVGDGFNDALMM
jgi:phospholipid-translocating ATPase